jgi:hypothetical protein
MEHGSATAGSDNEALTLCPLSRLEKRAARRWPAAQVLGGNALSEGETELGSKRRLNKSEAGGTRGEGAQSIST